MKTKDLIKQLQQLVDENEPLIEVLGEHEIMIDCFTSIGNHLFEYSGFTNEVFIDLSGDGVYHILRTFKE